MKDPNFEFLSSWNMSEYEDSVNSDTLAPVTEMTDERFQELGFPVARGAADTLDRARPPPDSVISNPFITFVSRKYSFQAEQTSDLSAPTYSMLLSLSIFRYIKVESWP